MAIITFPEETDGTLGVPCTYVNVYFDSIYLQNLSNKICSEVTIVRNVIGTQLYYVKKFCKMTNCPSINIQAVWPSGFMFPTSGPGCWHVGISRSAEEYSVKVEIVRKVNNRIEYNIFVSTYLIFFLT